MHSRGDGERIIRVYDKRSRDRRMASILAGFVMVLSLGAICAWITVSAIRTDDHASHVLMKFNKFYSEYVQLVSDVRVDVAQSLSPQCEIPFKYLIKEVAAGREEVLYKFGRFESYFRHQKRLSPYLRQTRGAFRRYRELIELHLQLSSDLYNDINASNTTTANRIFNDFDNTFRTTLRDDHRKAMVRLYFSLHSVAYRSRNRANIAALVSYLFTFFFLVLLLRTLSGVCEESLRQLEAQNKLARQQAHEMRNKLVPAIYCMNEFISSDLDPEDRLSSEMRTAVSVLLEVERQHQTRLDCYKIMRGTYQLSLETIDLELFMNERLEAERAIDRASKKGESGVSFRGSGCHNAFVRVDAYVLGHVGSNLLSNARKHTHRGEIVFSFLGENGAGQIVFRVSDTGSGVPSSIRSRLFQTEVTTGDIRGTGLGLPSCTLFCKAAGGYVKLVESTVSSGTTFEFALNGYLITLPYSQRCPQKKEALAPLPDNVKVFIIDDSAINRRCVERCMMKAVNNKTWQFFQFETIEAAKPSLEDSPHIIVLDENLESRGGRITGSQFLSELKDFKGGIISASGDPDMGCEHLALGAHKAWGKPLPRIDIIKADLAEVFENIDMSSIGNHTRTDTTYTKRDV